MGDPKGAPRIKRACLSILLAIPLALIDCASSKAFGIRQGLKTPIVDSAVEHESVPTIADISGRVSRCNIPSPGLSVDTPHPTLYDGFSVKGSKAAFLLNGAMGGGMRKAIDLKIHGGKIGTDGSGGIIPSNAITFSCKFPSGALDTNPIVHMPLGHPHNFMLDAIVLCAIPTADEEAMELRGSIAVTLSRTIDCIEDSPVDCKHLPLGTENYPPVDMCPSIRVQSRRNLSACLFVNLPTDLYRRGSGDFFGGRLREPLDDQIGLDLLTNWISFHVLVGFEHFYIYSSMFEQHSTAKRKLQIMGLEVKLREHVKRFGSLVTFVEWKLPVTDKYSIKSSWGPDFRWANMVQIPVFNDALWRFRQDTRWLAIFDLDEYMTPNLMHGHMNMLDALEQYEVGTNYVAAKQWLWGKLDKKAFLADEGHNILENAHMRRRDGPEHWGHGMKSVSKTDNVVAAGIHRPGLFYNVGLQEVVQNENATIELNHFKWSQAVGNPFSRWDAYNETAYMRECYGVCVRLLSKRFGQATPTDFECVASRLQAGCRAAP
jgi:hypothetical protein